jgi:hypothetical protein
MPNGNKLKKRPFRSIRGIMKINGVQSTFFGLSLLATFVLTGCSSMSETVLWQATPSVNIWHSTQYSMTSNYKLFSPDSANCLDIELVYSLKDLEIDEEAGSFLLILKLQDENGQFSQANFGTTYYIFDSGETGREYSPGTSPAIYGEESERLKDGILNAAICAPAGTYRFVLEDQWSGTTSESEEIIIR